MFLCRYNARNIALLERFQTFRLIKSWATGWHHGRLSDKGRLLAKELGERRCNDGIQAVFTSDLRRALETAEIAPGDTSIPILHD
ncbi:MAG: histidine phosphatase family protein [Acidobacteriota bacterium]